MTSQSTVTLRGPSALRSMVVRRARPMSRWISNVRPPGRPAMLSRWLRSGVLRGSIAYSALIQPVPLPSRNHGTLSVSAARQRTIVSPNAIRAEPSANFETPTSIVTGRSASAARPSGRLNFATRRLPQRPQLRVGVRLELASGRLRPLLDPGDVRGESVVRLTEGGLGVEAAFACFGHEIEQQPAEELRVVDVERQLDPRRPQLHPRRALLQPLGGEERRERARDPVEDRAARLLVTLDLLPLHEEVLPLEARAREHVRVAAHELLADRPRHVAEVEGAFLARELRVDRDLEQQVAELVAQGIEVAAVECPEGLVGLLGAMRPQAR